MGKIFYVMGKSASGKDTVYKRIMNDFPALQKIILYATRPIREGERDGEEYHFITENEMSKLRQTGKIIEIRTYHTIAGPWSYATVDDGTTDLAKADYLVIGTLESYEKVRAYYGADNVMPIYITVDDGIRMERALLREKAQHKPNYAELCRRYLADEKDFAPANLKRLGITSSYENDDFEKCIHQIENDMNLCYTKQ